MIAPKELLVPDLRLDQLTAPSWRRHGWPQAAVLLAVVSYTIFFSWFTIGRAKNFNAGWYDLGIMTQTVWRTGHGFGFSFTNPERGPGGIHGWTAPRTSIHSDYLMALLAPLSWFGHTAELLLIAQSAAVAAGAWYVWRITTRLIGRPWMAVVVAWAYLFSPPLQFATIFEFHSITLAITFLLAAVDALLGRRLGWYWWWAALALISKENVGLTLGLVSWVIAWWQGRRRLAWWALGLSWAWVVGQVLLVIPLSRPDLPATFTNKFYGGGATEGGFSFIQRLQHPALVWQKLITATHLHSGFQLVLPLGLLLPLLSPVILVAIPELLLYWLSDSPNQQTVVLHYHALVVPIILLSVLFSWRCWRLVAARWRWGRTSVDIVWMTAIVAGVVLAQAHFGPLPGAGQTRWPLVAWKERLTPRVTEALGLIPDRASVATTQNIGVLLAQRPTVYLLPSGVKQADYLVILQRQFPSDLKTNDKRLAEKVMLERLFDWLNRSSAYRQLYHVDRVYVWQRIGQDPRPLPSWPSNLLGQ